MNGEHNLALFCDFENVALGVRDARYAKFDIALVLERLLLKGSIVVNRSIKPRRPGLTQRSTRTQQRVAARLSCAGASSSPFILRSAAGPVNFLR